MKKNECISWEWKVPRLQKVFRIMKLTVFLLLLSVISVFASKSYSQTTLLNLDMENSTVKEVLRNIEKQSEFVFMYSEKLIDVNREVSVPVKNKKINEVLDELFAGTDVSYKVKDRFVLLTTPEVTGSDLMAQQQKSVSGKVTDSGGQPLPGVTIVVKGTTQGTITNADGAYSLTNIPEDATLVFSFVGMHTHEVVVGNQTRIDTRMVEETIGLEEVVAIGYGTQKKVNLTGSVASVGSEDLISRPVGNVAQMIQGKLAGVDIQQYTGEPGAENINIKIRGINSFGTSNSPIVLIDGFEGNLSSIDVNNVESISVLKDASSAAIYGSRAANGVILVTTKRGHVGESKITYHGNFASHTYSWKPDLINDPVEYMRMFNTASENSGYGKYYPQDIISKYSSGELKGYNWDDAFWEKPFVQNHNLTATGGSQKIRYNLGLNYWNQPGILHGYNYNQYKVLFNLDSEINKVISIGLNFNLSRGNRKGTHGGQSNDMILWAASAPTYGPFLPDGRYTWSAYDFEVHNANPVVMYENGGRWTKDYNILGNMYLKITPFEGLTWDTRGGIKYWNEYYKQQIPSVPTYYLYSGIQAGYLGGYDVQLDVTQSHDVLYSAYSTLTYNKSIGVHDLNILVGTSIETYQYNFLRAYRRELPNNELKEINLGSTNRQSNAGTGNEWSLGSYFGRINYSILNKYLFEANARIDGSSRFPSDNRYGIFPSFSAGWRISEEDFIKDINWLHGFKVRASWGQLGNQQIGNYPYQDLLSTGYSYAFGSSLNPGVVQPSLSNRNIKWETTSITDIGFDLDINNGLFSLIFDYYNKVTSDILRPGQVMATVGLGGPTINKGKMKNTGFDFVAGHRNNISEFFYSLDLNFGHYKNELVEFGAKEISGNNIKEEGQPYDSWYLNEWDGIFQSQAEIDASPDHYYNVRPGAIKIKDVNDDDKANLDDRVIVDGRYPDYSYGANLKFEWKNFDLYTFFQGVQGIKYFLQNWALEPFHQGSRPPVKWRNAWSEENPSNTLPYLYFAENEVTNRRPSTFWLMDGSYFKLKNAQFGYNLPDHIAKKIGAASARVYLSGDNLFVITNFEGFDPERNPNQSRFGEYPQLKIYSMGIKVEF
jgi:TonB-linked SusC/RagA family outer membrane protein